MKDEKTRQEEWLKRVMTVAFVFDLSLNISVRVLPKKELYLVKLFLDSRYIWPNSKINEDAYHFGPVLSLKSAILKYIM